jgi:lipoate-protein ligase B
MTTASANGGDGCDAVRQSGSAGVVVWSDLGRMPYAEAWELQHRLVDVLKDGDGVDRLLIVEHEPVLTLGRRAAAANILAGRNDLASRGIPVYQVERAGDVTYHGPGQLVAYPIVDLRRFGRDVRAFSLALLETVVRTLETFGIRAHPREGRHTGVWVDGGGGGEDKVAALGVRVESWVTYHGVAINVDPDLSHFELIVPCGLDGVRSASMRAILGQAPTLTAVRNAFVEAFGDVFRVAMVEGEPGAQAHEPRVQLHEVDRVTDRGAS